MFITFQHDNENILAIQQEPVLLCEKILVFVDFAHYGILLITVNNIYVIKRPKFIPHDIYF